MSTRVIIEPKTLKKVFIVICIIWALFCLTNISNNLKHLHSDLETMTRQLSSIDFAIRNY